MANRTAIESFCVICRLTSNPHAAKRSIRSEPAIRPCRGDIGSWELTATAVLTVLLLRVPESRNPEHGRLDWSGAMLATGVLGGLVFGLVESSNLGLTHPLVVATVVLGLAALALFVVVEARVPAPMMPLGLFQSRTFSGANAVTLLTLCRPERCAVLRSVQPHPGAGIHRHGLGTAAAHSHHLFLMSRWAGELVARFGARTPFVAAIGYGLFVLPGIGGSYWSTLLSVRGRARGGDGDQRRTAHDGGDGIGRRRARRGRVGHQQRRVADGRSAGRGDPGRRHLRRLRSRPRASPRGPRPAGRRACGPCRRAG